MNVTRTNERSTVPAVYIAVASGNAVVASADRRREIEDRAQAIARNLRETVAIHRLEPCFEDSYAPTGLLVGPDGDLYRVSP